MPFIYTDAPQVRKHGPSGYERYQSYKDWLRDKFTFQCVYCLEREQWYPNGHAGFGVDHVKPKGQAEYAYLVCHYPNLRNSRSYPLQLQCKTVRERMAARVSEAMFSSRQSGETRKTRRNTPVKCMPQQLVWAVNYLCFPARRGRSTAPPHAVDKSRRDSDPWTYA
jgi:hypothetical protein